MPLYEYQCKECARRTEKIQKFSDPELTVCPHCGGELERTITAPAVQFKGSGWYKDLYSSAKPAASGEKTSGEAASGDAGKSGGDAAGAAKTAEAASNSGAGSTGGSGGSGSGSGNAAATPAAAPAAAKS
jgi:putative FmdB family regulatory protein